MSAVPAWLWSPRALLVALVVTLLLTTSFAAGTSTASFGAYNPAWDGASGLQSEASAVDASNRIVLNTSAYGQSDPEETVAVILTPDRAYGPTDEARVREFVREGGTLVVAEDFGPHSNALLDALGVTTRFDGRLLRDERHYDQSPNITVATDVTRHPLTTGVEQLTLNHGTGLVAETGEESETVILVNSSSFAYYDANRNAAFDGSESIERRPVATVEPVGDGRVIAVSDPSLFINAMLDRPGNRAFVRTVFADHDRVLLDYSHTESLPPLGYALVLVRDSGPLQALVGLAGVAAVVVASRRGLIARLPGRSPGPARDEPVDPAALVAALREDHPEWDEERLERVARSRTERRDGSGEE
jgi:hypothetical protein